MTHAPAAPCLDCQRTAERVAREGGQGVCPRCRAVLGDEAPERTRNARRELAALVRWGHLLEGRAATLATVPGGTNPTRGRPDSIDERSPEIARAFRAKRRLQELHAAAHPEGQRYARVLWFAHGVRGEALNSWQSCADQVTERFAHDGEVEAWVASLDARRRARLTEPMQRLAFGNALLAAATDAYELDQWRNVVTDPLPAPISARRQWLQAMADRWEQERAKLLTPEGEPQRRR